MEKQETVNLTTWTLCRIDGSTGEPATYFNHKTQQFQTKFTLQCAFLDEKSCSQALLDLGCDETEIVKGTMKYPKETLVEIIGSTLSEYIATT